jgi:hypothetical protein
MRAQGATLEEGVGATVVWFFALLAMLFGTTVGEGANSSAIEGRVINTNGLAIGEATVSIFYAVPRDGKTVICPTCYPDVGKTTKTDGQGNFKITGVNEDLKFRLLVTAPGYRPDFIKNVDPFFSSALLKMVPIKFPAGPPERRVIGKLLDPEGKPIPRASITVEATRYGSGTSYGGVSSRVDPMAVTDEKGEFFLDCSRETTAIGVTIEPPALAKRRAWLDTGKAHLVRVKSGVTVTGRLVQDGVGIEGATVSMRTQNDEAGMSLRGFDIGTDADGRFTETHIPADAKFYLFTPMKEVRDLGLILPVQTVATAAEGSKLDLGDLKLQPGHSIRGKAILSDGKEVPAKTRIYLSTDDAGDSQDHGIRPDGSFTFTGVPAGRVDISLRIRGYHVSSKNPNKDWLNDGRLLGKVERDIKDFIILFEPGDSRGRELGPRNGEEQPRDKPLQGAKL